MLHPIRHCEGKALLPRTPSAGSCAFSVHQTDLALCECVLVRMQNWDGSGGNGAAVRHYEATGKQYPLAVKLGTITPRSADVFSYAEDDMVTDPELVRT